MQLGPVASRAPLSQIPAVFFKLSSYEDLSHTSLSLTRGKAEAYGIRWQTCHYEVGGLGRSYCIAFDGFALLCPLYVMCPNTHVAPRKKTEKAESCDSLNSVYGVKS